jgi:hypothetical protein
VGVKPDSDKDIGYLFDIVLHMQDDYSGLVTKSRAAEMKKGDRLKMVTWPSFAPIAAGYATGKRETLIEEDAASADEASQEQLRDEFQDRELVEQFVNDWKGQGAQVSDILAALKVSKLSQWTKGRAAAIKEMRVYVGLDKPLSQNAS